jgi:acyl-[acyl-carrier-protein]-phospholipid O-acyltransferase / long-chain-fatty-acid--[acyl-carrier-protein] ligase
VLPLWELSIFPLVASSVEALKMPNPSDSDNQFPLVTLRLLRQLKAGKKRLKVADSTGARLNNEELLIRTLALRRCLLREVIGADEKYVGVFLPPSAPAVVTNFALGLADRVTVNLNYTVSNSVLKQCCEVAELKHIITSRRFVEKVGMELSAPAVYLEDLKDKVSLGDKIFAALNAKLRSPEGLHKSLGLNHKKHSDPLTVIFTSGSTGVPKGVVLTGGNIDSNIQGIDEAIRLNDNDVVLGILPFFHSFGYTVTLWSALSLPCAAVFHYSPLEARPIGKLAEQYKATVLLATPTFLRSYIRRIEPEQFKNLDVVVVGAEKMPIALADEFEKRFGVRPVEGYGTTELSPLVSVNIPPSRVGNRKEPGLKEGSVGKTVTNVHARVVGFDSDEPLPTGEAGLLEIRGRNVMQGYMKRPDLTAEVMHGQWYRTGDVAMLDGQGFITITGRLSRFSKIGGEMVPHIQIEETMTEIVGSNEDGTMRVGITAIPDEKRGERLVVLYTSLPISKSELLQKMQLAGLPNLFLPGEDSFLEVKAIPVLGTGKLDLKGMRQVALDHFAK